MRKWILLAWLPLAGLPGCQTLDIVSPILPMEDATGSLGRARAPSAADVYVKLAAEYMKQGQFDLALRNARTAVETDGGNGEAHNILGLIYQHLKQDALSESHLGSAVRLEPRNPFFHNAYGAFLCEKGRYGEADQEFVRALENPLYPTPEMALNNAGVCAARGGDNAKAQGYFRQALQRSPSLPSALFQMADLEFQGNEFESARNHLRRFHEVSQPSPRSLWLAIRIERAAGNQDGAASFELLLRSRFPDAQEVELLRSP